MNDLDAERRRLLAQRLTGKAVQPSPREVAGIPALDRSASVPLSAGQRALLFEHRRHPYGATYNVTHQYLLSGTLDHERLGEALHAVVKIHEPLHIAFDSARTKLSPDQAIHIERVQIDRSELTARAEKEARKRIDLDRGPLVRAILAKHDDRTHGLVLTLHHASCDAGSLQAFWRDLNRAYQGEFLTPPSTTYADHGQWQADRVTNADVQFWVDQLAQVEDEPFNLRLRRPSDRVDGYLTMPLDVPRTVDSLSARPLPVFLAAYLAVLQSYTNSDAPVVGLAMSTRDHPATESLVGYFLSVLPLRVPIGESTFRQLVRAVESAVASGLNHRHVPLSTIVGARKTTGEADAEALSAMFVLDAAKEHELAGVDVTSSIHHNGTAVAPLTLFVRSVGHSWEVSLEFSGVHSCPDDARQLLRDYQVFLTALGDMPDTPIIRIAPGAPDDDVGATVGQIIEPLPTRIARHAEQYPDAPAVSCGSDRLTYGELLTAADALAGSLTKRGIGPGERVAVILPRSVQAIVAILGVQRAAAAYVPIDISYPQARRDHILAAPEIKAVIGTVASLAGVDHPAIITLPLEEVHGQLVSSSEDALPTLTLDEAAYTIFTSGSTGTPRGVQISHRQLASSTLARIDVYTQQPERFLVVSSIGFDSSVAGLFWTLVAGGELVLPTEDEVHNVDALGDLIGASTITHTLMVPSLYGALLRRKAAKLGSLQVVIVAGEACTRTVVQRHFGELPHAQLFNEYGPTEATVWSSFHSCGPADDPVPIGRAIPGAILRVADRWTRPTLPTVSGELLIGGAGVADGYIDDDAATAERFVQAPDGTHWYRSGDQVRRQGDGALEFLGRLDDQLSIGGIRIEPEEIEAVLISQSCVEAAVAFVDAVTDSDSRRLCAVVQAADLTEDELRRHCQARLPAALVPHRFEIWAGLPRTPHGKLDRRAVQTAAAAARPRHHEGETSAPAIEASDRLIDQMVAIWRDVLPSADLNADTDFFTAGGDSLAAVELTESLEAALGRPVAIRDIIEARTPRATARRLRAVPSAIISPGQPSLVEVLNAGDSRAPLLVLPGAPGQPVGFAHLTRALDSGQRVVGFRHPGIDHSEPLQRTVTGHAQRLWAELQDIDERPLRLLGLSTGGLLALELAQRLHDIGRTPELVVMVDTIFPGRQHLGVEPVAQQVRRLRGHGGPSTAVFALIATVKERLRQTWLRCQVTIAERTGNPMEPHIRHKQLNDIAYRSELTYLPKPYGGRVLFFAASTTRRDMTIEPWSQVLSDFQVEEIEGVHHLIVKDPDLVGPLAIELQRHLDGL